MTLASAIDRLRLAEADWTEALDAHIYAEPNPEFARRLRAFADASDRQREAFQYAAEEGLGWKAVPHEPGGRPAPYELSAGSGRVGPAGLWDRFDRAFAAWDRSLEGTDIRQIAAGFAELAAIARELADAVDDQRAGAPAGGRQPAKRGA